MIFANTTRDITVKNSRKRGSSQLLTVDCPLDETVKLMQISKNIKFAKLSKNMLKYNKLS